MSSGLVPRMAMGPLTDLLAAFRVVVVNGPRQSGKTTLLESLIAQHGGEYRSLDEEDVREVALADPSNFVRAENTPLVIDEVQRGGDSLVLAVKRAVDRNSQPGQFVLSGSTRFLTVPTLSESLAGRAVFIDVWPFAMAERVSEMKNAISALFDEAETLLVPGASTWSRADYLRLLCTGGYPEVVKITSDAIRRSWFNGYLDTVINRDIREFTSAHQIELLPNLLELVAARVGTNFILADVASSLGFSVSTLRNYLSYLETVCLVERVQAWSSNLMSRAAKTPRYFVTDSGLAASLLRITPKTLGKVVAPALGPVMESFVFCELLRLRSAFHAEWEIRFFRDRDGREIDFVIENYDGRIVGIEVKATSAPSRKDFKHLVWLREQLGDRFAAGVVIHLGERSLPFGERMYSLPLSVLWGHKELPQG